MPRPQKMVHLTPAQRRCKRFRHPLVNKAPAHMSEEQLEQSLKIYFKTGEGSDALIVNYFRLLRGLVGRYLYHWPITRRFLSEMVSSGAEAIVKTITKLKPEKLKDRVLVSWVEGAIRFNIETTINTLRGLTPAPRSMNFERERTRKNPVYGSIVAGLTNADTGDSREYNEIGLIIFEIDDAITVIARTDLEKCILDRENWGLSHTELGSKLNISAQHVGAIRKCLRERYINLGEEHYSHASQ